MHGLTPDDTTRGLTPTQRTTLLRPLNNSRVATRQSSGKTLTYLEAWDVKAHLIRIFGFANFDADVLSADLVFEREYEGRNGAMLEIAYKVLVRLEVRDENGHYLASYTEGAVGSASVGKDNASRGDAHDNALKSGASDAIKRCAINLGTQFGLSLYDDGNRNDIVKRTLVGEVEPPPEPTEEQAAAITQSLGATKIEEGQTA